MAPATGEGRARLYGARRGGFGGGWTILAGSGTFLFVFGPNLDEVVAGLNENGRDDGLGAPNFEGNGTKRIAVVNPLKSSRNQSFLARLECSALIW